MRLSQVHCRLERVITLPVIGTAAFVDGTPVRIRIHEEGVTLSHQNYAALCRQPGFDDAEWLTAAVGSDAYLAEVMSTGSSVVLRVLTFAGVELWTGARDIGLDDLALAALRRMNRRIGSVADALLWLQEELCLDGPDPCLVIDAGGSTQSAAAGFRVIGATITADVRLNEGVLLFERFGRRALRQTGTALLVRGQIRTVDAQRASALSAEDLAELQRKSASDNAYLAIWREYNELERSAAVAAAERFGSAAYDRRWRRADGRWEFTLVQSRAADAFRAAIGDATVGLEAGEGVAYDGTVKTRDEGSGIVLGEALVTATGSILIRPDDSREGLPPPPRGMIAGAFTLDKARLDRRDAAQQATSEPRTFPVQQLTRILADQPLAPVGRQVRHSPLSQKVIEILGGPPTDAQRDAIDVAINSQDLTVIQGPPGTGKTRVIAAIQARLAEIQKDTSALKNRVLLTSYQHDAVGNLVQAANDGRLPAVKLGRRNDPLDAAEVSAWASDLGRRLDRRYVDDEIHQFAMARRELMDRSAAYRLQPLDVDESVRLLTWISERADVVSFEVAHEAMRLARTVRQRLGSGSTEHSQAVAAKAVRALRVSLEGYLDDGPSTAAAAYKAPEVFPMLNDAQRRALERATGTSRPSPELLAELQLIRSSVLDAVFDARARAAIVATMPAVEGLLARAQGYADERAESALGAVERTVEQFRRAIVQEPEALRRSLEAHTRVLAATCQQSVSSAMRGVQSAPFDTVIIDEAARANPLDLMIPMTLATGRVVLVGDHRQLPQLLDDDLVPQLSSRHDGTAIEAVLSRSLFERLFTKLRDHQIRDGQRRVVTLDRQFRMHPLLGSFVNEQFYLPHGEAVHNGNSDPLAFSHQLPQYKGSACGWIDVPHTKGPESRGSSTSRAVEANVIVRELAEAVAEPGDHTFGVITFYKGQEEALWTAMVEAGLAVAGAHGHELNPSAPTLWTDRGTPRVRIGTVDAFQGREFDVVYLSTTRSNKPRHRGGRSYGFLVLPNRLCVAMSRQRRLLIAVGDAEMFTCEEGRELVPSLRAFHDLTGGEHGFRRSA